VILGKGYRDVYDDVLAGAEADDGRAPCETIDVRVAPAAFLPKGPFTPAVQLLNTVQQVSPVEDNEQTYFVYMYTKNASGYEKVTPSGIFKPRNVYAFPDWDLL
jgi:hypothetical protein